MMHFFQFLVVGALLFCTSAAQEKDGKMTMTIETSSASNCTIQKDEFLAECKTEHEVSHIDLKMTDIGASEDPFNVWQDDKMCHSNTKLGDVLGCYYGKIEECHRNNSIEEDLPSPDKVKEAVTYLCDQKTQFESIMNASTIEECLETKIAESRSCMTKGVTYEVTDKCSSSNAMVLCVAKVDCLDEPVFENYVKLFTPPGCGSTSLTATLAVVALALLATLFS